MYDQDNLELYFNFVEARHRIWEKRQAGESQPWTANDVLARRKFTNCFRVLDPGSQFVLTDLKTDNPIDFITRCVFYRITNRPATWRFIRDEMGGYPTANTFANHAYDLFDVIDGYRHTGNTVFSGAYTIMPNPGVVGSDKVWDAIALTKRFVDHDYAGDFFEMCSQEERFRMLNAVPGIGKFLAMQILTDWGYGQNVNRENEFVVAGPGARAGTAFLNPSVQPEQVIRDMSKVWDCNDTVQVNGHPLGLMNVQNTFCEFGKFMKELANPRKKTLYKPSHPGTQPAPVLPSWMQ